MSVAMDGSLFEVAEAPAAHVVPPHPGVTVRDGYWWVSGLTTPRGLGLRLELELDALALTRAPGAPGLRRGAGARRRRARLPARDGRAARGDVADGERAPMMIGGSVLPEARGRGVYRSLVAARWRTAAERGTPALVTTANDQSAPILRSVGFRRLGDVEIWVDRL